jgi:hypothetical protein
LTVRIGIKSSGKILCGFTHQNSGSIASGLNDFKTTENIASGICESFSLFGGNTSGKLFGMFTNQGLELEENSLALLNRNLSPSFESLLSTSFSTS